MYIIILILLWILLNCMENLVLNHFNEQEELKFSLKIFLIVISISIILLSVVAYSFKISYEMSNKFTPLIDATMEIRLEATTAHLWFEEIMSGDRSEKIEDVMKHIDSAIWYATAMLEGGNNPEGNFISLANPIIRKDIKEILAKIRVFKEITVERYSVVEERGAGTPIDQKYDSIFRDFLEQADLVETKLQQSIAIDMKKYRSLQFFLLTFLVLATIALLFIFYKYEKQRLKDVAAIREAYEEVKVLGGFIPICASCKNIRDDNGFWSQVEAYISEHSEAEFSHSLCPDCAKALYPEFYESEK